MNSACVCVFRGGIGCRDICSCRKTGSNQGNDLQNWAHLNSLLFHVEIFLFAKWHSVTTLDLVWHITNLNKRTGPGEFLCLRICMPLSIATGHDLRVLCALSVYLWMSYCFHALVFTPFSELCYLNIIVIINNIKFSCRRNG